MADREYVVGVRVATESDDAPLVDYTEQLKELAREQDKHERRLRKLLDDLEPLRAAQDRYLQSLKDLTHAYAEGTISEERYLSTRKALFERHQEELAKLREGADATREGGRAAGEASGGFRGLARTIKGELIGALSGLLAFSAIARWLYDGAKAALEKHRALKQLSNVAAQFGQDGDAAADAAKRLGNALESRGFNDVEVIEGVRELVHLTRDYSQAVSAASLAADISAKTGKSYGEALGIVKLAISGGPRSLLTLHRELGIEATTAQGALDELQSTVAGYADTVDDKLQQIQSASEELGNLAETLGEPLADVGIVAIKVIKTIAAAVSAVFLGIRTAWLEVKNIPANLKAAWDNDSQSVVNRQQATAEEIKGMWEQWAAELRSLWTGVSQGAPRPPEAQVRLRHNPLADETAARKALEERTKLQQLWTDVERENADRRVELLWKEIREKARLEEMWAQIEKENIATRNNAAAAEVAERERLERMWTDVERENEQARSRMRQQAAWERQMEVESQRQAVSQLGNLVVVAFGRSKQAYVAQAIIEAFLGASRAAEVAASGGPWAAAAAYIATLVQLWAAVEGIQSTEIGSSGGGTPSGGSGAQAVTPGTGWAGAQSPMINRRAPGTATLPTATTTVTNQQFAPSEQINIHVNALTGAEGARAAREVARRVNRGNRGVNRSLAWSEPTRIGSRRSR